MTIRTFTHTHIHTLEENYRVNVVYESSVKISDMKANLFQQCIKIIILNYYLNFLKYVVISIF